MDVNESELLGYFRRQLGQDGRRGIAVRHHAVDGLVSDLVECGHDFQLAYYPDEDHMFAESATWRDALDRVLPFLDEHLVD
jgi:hypothetical protein